MNENKEKKESFDNESTQTLKALEPKGELERQQNECPTCKGNRKITIGQQVIDCPTCKGNKDV